MHHLKVVIIPDKLKGSLAAGAAAQAIARGWRRVRPRDELELLPLSDGGEGFGEIMAALLGAEPQRVNTVDAAHRPRRARWWWEPKSRTAIVESAEVVGLALLPAERLHPFELDTFGLGGMLRAIARKGAIRCLVGVGGSATNDGGFGLARSLGWQFLNRSGGTIDRWSELASLARIAPPPTGHLFNQLTIAADVDNRLLGPLGATRVYGPQKGLRPRELARAERCLARLAKIVEEQFGGAAGCSPGSGAAGGLGFGLIAFAGGRLQPGFELFRRQAGLERRLHWADLAITAEGRLDRSSFMGKGVGRVARRCRELELPCICLAGTVAATGMQPRAFHQIYALTSLANAQAAIAKASFWLEHAAALAAREYNAGSQRSGPC